MTKLSVIYCMDIDPPVTSHSYGKWSIYIYIIIVMQGTSKLGLEHIASTED